MQNIIFIIEEIKKYRMCPALSSIYMYKTSRLAVFIDSRVWHLGHCAPVTVQISPDPTYCTGTVEML